MSVQVVTDLHGNIVEGEFELDYDYLDVTTYAEYYNDGYKVYTRGLKYEDEK